MTGAVKIVGLMPVRNEDWCLGLTLRAALQWCDEVVVLLHACEDESGPICGRVLLERDHAGVHVIVDQNSQWDEMQHRQRMLELARDCGATHIAILDADEILTANLLPAMRSIIESMPSASILRLPGYNLRGGIHQYHFNGIWGQRWFSTAFTDLPPLRWSGDRFHAREPEGFMLRPHQPVAQGDGGIMHLWGASERRLRAKHQLYRITERLRWPSKPTGEINRQYNLYRSPADCAAMYPTHPQWAVAWQYASVPNEWWKAYRDLGWMEYLNTDAEPWQERESLRLVESNPGVFEGVDLSDLAQAVV